MRDETPITDPVATRELAARLRAASEHVHDRALRLDRRLDALRFEGPAALRLRAAGAEQKLRANQIAGELQDLAADLSHSCDAG
jgi:hypothetical protein